MPFACLERIESAVKSMKTILVLLCLLTLGGCDRYPETANISLVSEFATARKSFIVNGEGPVGRPSFRAFMGVGLMPDAEGDWARAVDNERVRGFGFFLYEPQSLTLELEARTNQKEALGRVRFFLQDHEIKPSRPNLASDRLILQVDAHQVAAGMNWLEVEQAQGVEWRTFQALPQGSGRTSDGGIPVSPQTSADGQDLLLPFGQSVDYSLMSDGKARFAAGVSVWQDPGSTPLDPRSVSLDLTVTQENPPRSQTFRLDGIGAKTFQMPENLGAFGLRVQAHYSTDQPPLPGQVGLRLSEPTLERSTSPIQPPIPTASFTPSTGSDDQVAGPTQRPNVLLYVVDTLRADRLSLYGHRFATSPHLEELAQDGVTFDNATAQSPWTKPSMASIMTSLEPRQHGVLDFADRLDEELTTWAECLQRAGYQTGAVVANPMLEEQFHFNQGFDSYRVVSVTKTAADLNQMAIPWLENRNPEQPFFLFLQPIDPHSPYLPSSPWRRKAMGWYGASEPPEREHPLLPSIDRAGFSKLFYHLYRQAASGLPPDVPESTQALVNSLYDGEVASTDEAFGDLVAWLKSQDLYDNTMIVFTSDHGEEIFDHGNIGHVHSLYQELVRIPLVMKFAQRNPTKSRESGLWQQIDLLPTVLEQAGVARPANLMGRAYHPGQANDLEGRPAFFEVEAGRDAKETKQASHDFLEEGTALRTARWKLIHFEASAYPKVVRGLFDLQKDATETDNLILEYPVTALELERQLSLHKNLQRLRNDGGKASHEETRKILKSLQYLR